MNDFSTAAIPAIGPVTRLRFGRLIVISSMIGFMLSLGASTALGQGASLAQAMAINPKQKDAPYEVPTAAEMKACKIEKSTTPPGFVVTDGSGRVLRRFLDNNKDGKLDQWSYYENGIEVYRDLDTDFDRKTDQYRWLGSGGTRWGLDPDEDGRIDSWKTISPEEVAYETFMAIRDGDSQRFDRLLLTPQEFSSLKLGKPSATRIKERWQKAKSGFSKGLSSSLKLPRGAEWVQWGNGRPSMCIAGTDGNANDVICFDHASGVYQAGKDFGQIAIGSILKVGDVWRLVELPELVTEGEPINNGGVLFSLPPMPGETDPDDRDQNLPNPLADLFAQIGNLDEALQKATKGSEIAKLHQQKAAAMQEVYFKDEKKNRRNWLENIADTVSSAYVDEKFPNGIKVLDGFVTKLKQARITDGVDYVQWRAIFAKYGLDVKIRDNKGRAKAEDELIESVEDFVDRFPKSRFAAEGMFQLALNKEISERDEDAAIQWYKKIISSFPGTNDAARAAGAVKRLTGQGKPLVFQSKTARGQAFSLANPSLRGKIVILHYWENWCADEFDTIERLAEKHKSDVVFIGCNTDSTTAEFRDFMAKNRNVTWLQLHEPGGVEKSPLAHQLGVSTLPLVLLIDSQGKLIESNLAFGDLEREIQRELRRAKRSK
jgi:thiol-disulfide isomerase/thioredoxin